MSGGKGKLRGAKDGVPFVKGDPRCNRNGRPKKLPELEQLLAEVLGEEKNDITAMQGILLALRKKALSGDVRAAELLMDRGYGKLKVTKDVDLTFEKMDVESLDYVIDKLLNK